MSWLAQIITKPTVIIDFTTEKLAYLGEIEKSNDMVKIEEVGMGLELRY